MDYENLKKKLEEVILCFGDALDSRVVVGPGELTLLPGHVREWGHHGGLQGVRSFIVGPVEDPLTGPTKNNWPGGAGGANH